MSYCPSQDWDRYCAGQEIDGAFCPACGNTDDDRFKDCDCGEVVCSECSYCPKCCASTLFTPLPEDYFWRICAQCKGTMNWQDVARFSEAIGGYPVAVHKDCLEAAQVKDQELWQSYQAAVEPF